MRKKTNKKNANSAVRDFVKAEATGNDFILLDMRQKKSAKEWRKFFSHYGTRQAVKFLCDRNFGIGADGVVLLGPPKNPKNNLHWDFFNSDGSVAEMCGNASRCVGAYEGGRGPLRLETLAGVIEVTKNKDEFTAKFPPIRVIRKTLSIAALGRRWTGIYINSAVPHFVIEIKSAKNILSLGRLAGKIKDNKNFRPKGTNITFYRSNGRSAEAATHERGIEAFTKSCGTGAVAVAWVLNERFGKSWNGKIKLPGGTVRVNLDSRVELTGPARVVFRGKYGA